MKNEPSSFVQAEDWKVGRAPVPERETRMRDPLCGRQFSSRAVPAREPDSVVRRISKGGLPLSEIARGSASAFCSPKVADWMKSLVESIPTLHFPGGIPSMVNLGVLTVNSRVLAPALMRKMSCPDHSVSVGTRTEPCREGKGGTAMRTSAT